MRAKSDPPGALLGSASLLAIALSLTCPACSDCNGKPSGSKATTSKSATDGSTKTTGRKALRGKPRTMEELPTTSADIFFGNLDGQIEEITRLTKLGPPTGSRLRLASGLHYTRGRFRGDLDEIQLGLDELTRCIELEPDTADCVIMRAEQEQSLHRFPAARADVERARKLGVDAARATDVETDLEWNAGNYDTAIKAIREARLRHPTAGSWIREAQLEHDLGMEDNADAAFEAAEDLIVDTGPLQVAHLNVQRGIQKANTGRLEEAIVFFREAVARIPNFVTANEHLAETLHQLGRDEEATRIYESIVKESNDPEFMHALATLYDAHGKKAEALELSKKSASRYEALLVKYPEAMYWHASEFYMDIGNTPKALELLRKNVVLRPNSVSLTALARAEHASHLSAEAKASIDKALAMPVRSAELFSTASKIYAAAGDTTKSAVFLAQAKALNPRIAQ